MTLDAGTLAVVGVLGGALIGALIGSLLTLAVVDGADPDPDPMDDREPIALRERRTGCACRDCELLRLGAALDDRLAGQSR